MHGAWSVDAPRFIKRNNVMQGLQSWVKLNLRGRKGQGGFTLIELLVVVTILGILAGIVTLSLVGLTTHANVQACNTEYKTVQAALDAFFANQSKVNGTQTIPQQTTFTNDMTAAKGGAVQLYTTTPTDTTPNYTRNGTTQFYYQWDQYGRILAIADANGKPVGNPNDGTGCVPK
jgi:prepilin-type N-terminal cleavage/methylation domain-containing protein